MMTAEDARRPTVAELADLDAGLVEGREVDAATAGRLRSEAALDPRSNEVLDALAATRAELAAAPLPQAAPPAQRWAALFDEHAGPGEPAAAEPSETQPASTRPALTQPASAVAAEIVPVDVAPVEVAPAPVVPLRARRARPALVAAALLVAVAVAVALPTRPAEQRVSRAQLLPVALQTTSVLDAGGLDDPVRRAECLRTAAPQVAAGAQLIGARRVEYEGTSGVLLLLGTGRLGAFTAVVVDPACGPALAVIPVP